ncbi:MAG TPA: hypothetical protein VIS76_03020 [Pseudomonadales bacterium]
MSPGYHIATDDGLITVQVRCTVALADLQKLAETILADEKYDPVLPLLFDLRDMRLDLNSAATDSFSRFVVANFRGRAGSMAVIIDGDMNRALSAGIFWLSCALGGTEVFEDYDHALKWLIRREFAPSLVVNR